MSLPITERRVSAWTKSISSSAATGSATSQPKSCSTCGARRRATSEPSGFETPVRSTRRGLKGGTTSNLTSGALDRIYSGRPQMSQSTLRSSWPRQTGRHGGDPDSPAPLWIYASNRRRVGHALHRQCVRGGSHVDALVHRCVEDLVERAGDH